jgi:hypothetical protein
MKDTTGTKFSSTARVGETSAAWAKILKHEMVIRIQSWVFNNDGIYICMLNFVEQEMMGLDIKNNDFDSTLLEFWYSDKPGSKPPVLKVMPHFLQKENLQQHLRSILVPTHWLVDSPAKAWFNRQDYTAIPTSHRQLLPIYYGFGIEFRRGIEAAEKRAAATQSCTDIAVEGAMKETWSRWVLFAQGNSRANVQIPEDLPV